MRILCGFVRWTRGGYRMKGVSLIGSVPAFGWRFAVGGKSIGVQWSTGSRHGYVLVKWGEHG
jgi:hypothetical protein